jgi:hypothetical protein
MTPVTTVSTVPPTPRATRPVVRFLHGSERDAQPGVAADRRQASLAGSLVAALLGGG